MFKGARTYEEVLDRGQTLSPDLQTSFLTFQRHRKSGLPKVLQGESTTPPPTQENTPLGFRKEVQDKSNTKENPSETKTSLQNAEIPQTENLGAET